MNLTATLQATCKRGEATSTTFQSLPLFHEHFVRRSKRQRTAIEVVSHMWLCTAEQWSNRLLVAKPCTLLWWHPGLQPQFRFVLESCRGKTRLYHRPFRVLHRTSTWHVARALPNGIPSKAPLASTDLEKLAVTVLVHSKDFPYGPLPVRFNVPRAARLWAHL